MLNTLKKILLESKIFMISLITLTAVGITVSGIITGQQFFKILPLYVSLGVMFLQSKAMRLGPLVGGLNCILYTIVYLSYGLYASALTTILMSFPIQIATFIMWSRKKSGLSTRFKTLSRPWLFAILGIMAVAYVPLLISNKAAGGSYIELDTAGAVVAFASSALMLFAFSNYIYFQITGCFISMLLYIFMLRDTPEQLCYLIYNIYSTICCIRGALNISIIKKKQVLEDAEEKAEGITAKSASTTE